MTEMLKIFKVVTLSFRVVFRDEARKLPLRPFFIRAFRSKLYILTLNGQVGLFGAANAGQVLGQTLIFAFVVFVDFRYKQTSLIHDLQSAEKKRLFTVALSINLVT